MPCSAAIAAELPPNLQPGIVANFPLAGIRGASEPATPALLPTGKQLQRLTGHCLVDTCYLSPSRSKTPSRPSGSTSSSSVVERCLPKGTTPSSDSVSSGCVVVTLSKQMANTPMTEGYARASSASSVPSRVGPRPYGSRTVTVQGGGAQGRSATRTVTTSDRQALMLEVLRIANARAPIPSESHLTPDEISAAHWQSYAVLRERERITARPSPKQHGAYRCSNMLQSRRAAERAGRAAASQNQIGR